ncbi:MAG: hypothetical protein ACTSUV_05435 [Candidatus Ranarchaeia archaeon]
MTEINTDTIKGTVEKPTFVVEFFVKASKEHLLEASKKVLGSDLIWQKKRYGYSASIMIHDCPVRLLFFSVEENTYYIMATSQCKIDNCPNINRCLEVDARNFEKFKRRIQEIAGKSAIVKLQKKTDWRPEHINKGFSSSLIIKALQKK